MTGGDGCGFPGDIVSDVGDDSGGGRGAAELMAKGDQRCIVKEDAGVVNICDAY